MPSQDVYLSVRLSHAGILSKWLEWCGYPTVEEVSETFNDTKQRAVSLRQLSFLLNGVGHFPLPPPPSADLQHKPICR